MYSRRIGSVILIGMAVFCSTGPVLAADLYPSLSYLASNAPAAVVMADMNGDGYEDIIEAGENNYIAVMLNKKDGTFASPKAFYQTDGIPQALAIGDVNGDGIPDIVSVSPSTNDVSVLIGVGNGLFHAETAGGSGTAAPIYAVGVQPVYVTLADLNGDGRLDIVTADYQGDTVSVLINRGNGTFKRGTTYAVGRGPDCVEVADMNGDGKPDIVVVNSGDNTLMVLRGKGDGSVVRPQTTLLGFAPALATFQSIAIADVNHDGHPDVAITDTGTAASTVQLLLGKTGGGFGHPKQFKTDLTPRYVRFADVDGDGNSDIIVSSTGVQTIQVMLGNGAGWFHDVKTYPAAGISGEIELQGFAVGDVNNDGKPDIVSVNPSSLAVKVFINRGDGSFNPPGTYNTGDDPSAVATGDLNGDGHTDVVVADAGDNQVEVRLGNGDGSFQPATTYGVGANPQRVVLKDLDGDGKLDLVTANFGDGSVSVRLGNGDGTFRAESRYPAGEAVVGMAVGDMNQDGHPDIVVANSVVNTVSILLNKGNGTFAVRKAYPASNIVDDLAVGDVNHDGFPDVVTVGGAISVLFNDKQGGLEPVPLNASNVSTHLYVGSGFRVDLADLDHDGNLDIIVVDYSGSQIDVLRGNRLGFFLHPFQSYLTCSNPLGIAIADVNNDGNQDAVVTCTGQHTVATLFGNGLGGFVGAIYPAEIEPRDVAVADFNEDGEEDLAIVNGVSKSLNIELATPNIIAKDNAPQSASGTLDVPDGKTAQTGILSAIDKDGDFLTYGVVQNAHNGTVSLSPATGDFSYLAGLTTVTKNSLTPPTPFVGKDQFEYQVTDGVKLSNIAVVSVTVDKNTTGQGGGGGGLGLVVLAVLASLLAWRQAPWLRCRHAFTLRPRL